MHKFLICIGRIVIYIEFFSFNSHIIEKRDEYSDHRLWEVQRILTALKRKARNLERQLNEDRRREQEDLEQLLKEEQYEQV